MNDLDTLKAMLEKAGIQYKETLRYETAGVVRAVVSETVLVVEDEYVGFGTHFVFNGEGALTKMPRPKNSA